MRIDNQLDYFKKYNTEIFSVEYDFTGDLATGETVTTCLAASIYDSGNVERTASMLSGVVVTTPDITFDVSAGTAGETYNLKVVAETSVSNKFVHYIVCEVLSGIELNTKLGDIGINSYVTLTEANNYIRNKYGHENTWDQLADEGKSRILVQAAKDLEVFNYVDERYYDVQGLSFPRSDHDVITGNCAATITTSGFTNTSLFSTTYNKYPTNYWKYGTVHIISGTPLGDVRVIDTSNYTTGAITITVPFSVIPTTSTQFKVFAPLNQKVKDAQCEQAIYIVQNQRVDSIFNYRGLGVNTIEIGDSRLVFNDETPGSNDD